MEPKAFAYENLVINDNQEVKIAPRQKEVNVWQFIALWLFLETKYVTHLVMTIDSNPAVPKPILGLFYMVLGVVFFMATMLVAYVASFLKLIF